MNIHGPGGLRETDFHYGSHDWTPATHNIIILTKEYFVCGGYILRHGHTFP